MPKSTIRQDIRETMKSVLAIHFRATTKCLTLEEREEVRMNLAYGIDELRGMLNELDNSVRGALPS